MHRGSVSKALDCHSEPAPGHADALVDNFRGLIRSTDSDHGGELSQGERVYGHGLQLQDGCIRTPDKQRRQDLENQGSVWETGRVALDILPYGQALFHRGNLQRSFPPNGLGYDERGRGLAQF